MWLQQSPDEDAVSPAVIEPYITPGSTPLDHLAVPFRSSRSHRSNPSIDYPVNRRLSYTSACSSAGSRAPSSIDSSKSNSSNGRNSRPGKRLHHRAAPYPSPHHSIAMSNGSPHAVSPHSDKSNAPRFFCTVSQCHIELKSPYDWKRHEESVHFTPWQWICCKDQETFRKDQCLFCQDQCVDVEHMRKHRFFHCSSKPDCDRLYSRKDQLWEHIRRYHHTHKNTENPGISKTLDLWKRPNPQLDHRALFCGFCGRTFQTWDQRAQHVINHFKDGLDLSAWWPLRVDNDFRHEYKVLQGPHDPRAAFNSPYYVCPCCPEMAQHITEYHPLWYCAADSKT
jgi:hypothetical protein